MSVDSGHDSLLKSPTNLKEAIDWILRLTGKDGTPNTHCLCLLSEVIHDLVRDVEGYLDKEELEAVRGTLVDLQGVEGTRRITGLLEGVSSGLGLFVGWEEKGDSLTGNGIGSNGGNGTNQKYTSSYKREGSDGGSTTDNMSWDKIYQKCISNKDTPDTLAILARILLGAIPLVFSGLSYLYWLLGVERDTFREGQSGNYKTKRALVDEYMRRMGYDTSGIQEIQVVDKKSKDNKETNTLKDVFGKCQVFEGVEVKGNYAQYLEKLRTEAGKDAEQKDGQTTDNHYLLILNTICSGYFRSLHTIDSIRSPAPRTPNTVREILYWLTSLPYCPIYRTLVPKVQEMIRVNGGSEGKVVFYNGYTSLNITAQNCGSYLLGAALVAPMVLLTIQDTIESRVGNDQEAKKKKIDESNYKLKNSTPVAIHDLYANMQFRFTYPLSETQSYYLLQDCLVALFYQMYFLKHVTFSDYTGGFAWGWCKYGDKVVCDQISGWMCPGGGKNGQQNCGTPGGKASPLQAFLTDCLKGFTCPVVMDGTSGTSGKKYKENLEKLRNSSGQHVDFKTYTGAYPGFLDHRGHTASVFGQECAVPMGFSGSFRSGGPIAKQAAAGQDNGMIGLGIQAVLSYYSNDDVYSSGLYQVTRCISSLTRRVPRSTGTLYGFFYGLGEVYSGKQSSKFKPKLIDELNCCPGWRDPECLMEAVRLWRGGSHKDEKSGKHDKGTLDSLYASGDHCNNAKASCGYYLNPLTGSLYNSVSDRFCETYVSWIVHLTWRLRDGLESLLKEFVKIDCSKSGCTGKSGSIDHCCKGGTNHGTACRCDNVVKCAGVHGLFYRFGFTYRGPDGLMWDGGSGNNNYKRNCNQFYERLKTVIEGQYFQELFAAINQFLYSTRALFGVYIGVYWLAVMGYLLWSMTYNLDLLHIQSHWRSPRSYLVPLQRILADGSRNVKRVCTIGYFQESGDSLLSLGVSDVYL